MKFSKLALHSHGLIAATEDSNFFFFKQSKETPIQFSLITKWEPKFKEEELPITSKFNNKNLYQIDVYDLVKEQLTLVGVLENQNAFSVNLWDNIYSP